MATKKIAILGGAFDPPHLGHILLTQYVLAAHPEIDQLWWLPCAEHRFGKKMTAFSQRLQMCRLAVASFPSRKVKVDPFEQRHQLDGRTLLTLRALQKQFLQHRFIWVIGSDNFKERRRWYHFATIERDFGFIVVPRGVPRGGTMGIPDISSRQIRRRLKTRKPLIDLVVPAVEKFIHRNHLYSRKKIR
jgi:nicotinate-nucleotide adenylyltransferase